MFRAAIRLISTNGRQNTSLKHSCDREWQSQPLVTKKVRNVCFRSPERQPANHQLLLGLKLIPIFSMVSHLNQATKYRNRLQQREWLYIHQNVYFTFYVIVLSFDSIVVKLHWLVNRYDCAKKIPSCPSFHSGYLNITLENKRLCR